MNAWFSAERSLMGHVFQYLRLKDVCKWRMSSKNTELTDAFSTGNWVSGVREEPGVHACSSCHRLRGYKGLFPCQSCRRTVCVDHVVTCTYCLYELCMDCAVGRGCRNC